MKQRKRYLLSSSFPMLLNYAYTFFVEKTLHRHVKTLFYLRTFSLFIVYLIMYLNIELQCLITKKSFLSIMYLIRRNRSVSPTLIDWLDQNSGSKFRCLWILIIISRSNESAKYRKSSKKLKEYIYYKQQ